MATPVDVEFRIPAPRESIFAFSGDLVALGNLVPGVASIEETGNPSQAVWHMQIKLGLMKVKQDLVTTILELEDPSFAKFSCESKDMAMAGTVSLTDAAEGETDVVAHFEAEGRGTLARLIDTYLEPKLIEYARGFSENLQAKVSG